MQAVMASFLALPPSAPGRGREVEPFGRVPAGRGCVRERLGADSERPGEDDRVRPPDPGWSDLRWRS